MRRRLRLGRGTFVQPSTPPSFNGFESFTAAVASLWGSGIDERSVCTARVSEGVSQPGGRHAGVMFVFDDLQAPSVTPGEQKVGGCMHTYVPTPAPSTPTHSHHTPHTLPTGPNNSQVTL